MSMYYSAKADMRSFVIFFVLIGFVGISLTMSQVFGFEPAMNQAPLSYFGYFDEHDNKLTKLVVGKEYHIKAKFFWPESYSQPYEFFAEINDDKNHIVIERFTTRGIMTPNSELEVSFSWSPKEEGMFRNFSELWATDGSTVITGVPQYDFEVVSSNDTTSHRTPSGSFSLDKTVYPVPWEIRSPLKQSKAGVMWFDVKCKAGLELVVKTNGYPKCVKPTSVEKLVAWGYASTNRSSDLANPETYTITEDGKTFQIKYSLSGARLVEIVNDKDANSIHVKLDGADGGGLVISIPRDLLDARIGNEDDYFFVLIDGKEYLYGEKASEDERTLTVAFPKGAHNIEIIVATLI